MTYRETLKRNGINRVILARCDAAESVAFGQAVGINLFQGCYIEKLLVTKEKRHHNNSSLWRY